MYSKIIFAEDFLPSSIIQFVEGFTGLKSSFRLDFKKKEVIFQYFGPDEKKFLRMASVWRMVIKNLAKEDLVGV